MILLADKKAKLNYKRFDINTIPDALVVLGSLISEALLNLDKFDEYTTEAMALLAEVSEDAVEEPETTFINAKTYDDINDKSLFRQREILALLADEAHDIFSYKSFRKWLRSHEVEGKTLITRELPGDVAIAINDLHDVRNWSFHNVQSRLVAEKMANESKAEEVEKELGFKPVVTPQINPVMVVKHKAYTRDILESLIEHNLVRHKMFESIIDELKQDYQDIFDILVETDAASTAMLTTGGDAGNGADSSTGGEKGTGSGKGSIYWTKMPRAMAVMNPGMKNLVDNCKSDVPMKIMIYEDVVGLNDMASEVADLSMKIQKRKI